ncbi:MAG: hypothetical protein NTX94_01085 [Caldiserica bacterium]|nr:hypothetical protein [Caldisericota bacterium]
MLIQVAMNNIESVEQGEEILKKWHYHLDEDQSHVVMERDALGVTIRISGFHPWADEMEEDGAECSCGGDGDNCECNGNCGKNAEDATTGQDEEIGDEQTRDDEGDDDVEESEVIYLGQALFVPVEDQARVLATELLDDDYIGTASVSVKDIELTDTDAFRALPADTKDAVIAAIEELGDAETYLSLYEVMGLKD